MLTSLALSWRAPIRRALVALPLAVAVAAAQQWSPTTPIPFDSTVIRGTLPNGLRYFIKKNAKPEKRLELQLAVRTGSLQEDDDQRGMAHYVEHMAFNGTARFPKSAIVDFLEQSGMRFGGDLNAYTSFDETVYNLTIPTDSTHLVTRALDVMRDWAGAVSFDSLEFERERGVVLEEWRSGRGAQQRVAMKHYPYQFYGSRYTERLPIGTQQSLERASRAALMRYYADWYRPDLMAVVAVGDIDPEQLRTMIVERFGSLKNPAAPRPRVAAMIPDHDSTFVSIAADKEYQGNIITVLWKSPKDSVRTVADYRRSLVAGLYGLLMGNRLSELSQRPNTPFQFAAVVHGALTPTRDVTQAFASVKGNAFAASLEAVLLEMDRVNRFGFTATELDRARANFTRGLERQVAEADKALSAGLAQQYVGSFLSGGSVPSITTVQAIATQLMAGITIDEVNRAARDWTPTRNRVVTVSAPERADVTLPTREDLLAVFDKVKSATLVAFVDSTSNQPLVPTVPVGGKVVGVKSLPETGITEWTLSNGIRVLLKPTDFKNDEVRFSGRRPGGSSLFSDAEALDAGVMPFTLGGLGTFTPTTLSKALTGKVANASVAVSPNSELASGFASPKDLETMFQLLYLRFTAPRFDSLNFNVTKQALKTNLRNTANSPDAVFGDTISRVMSNYNPRVRLFNAAVLDSVNAARAFSLYQSRVKDASGFTFYFVGNFTLDGIRPLIERWIGALPTTPKAVSTWKDRGIRPPPGIVVRTVRKGTEPKAETTLRFHGDFAYSWENRFVLTALRELLDIRLREALREEKGGTYGVSVSQLGSWVPYKRYQVSISFGSAPERVEELTTRMWGVIDSIAAQGASDTDVAKIKEIFIRNHETALKQNASWLNWMNDHDEDGRDQRTTLRYPALVNTLTSAMLRDAANRYLTHQQYARFTLLPESAPAKVP
ncbi:MAG: insulinase family protein [Gemmatimonadaceae bacterium]|nr:insulinase family protein [Gemmatimonadaceae bacterium]